MASRKPVPAKKPSAEPTKKTGSKADIRPFNAGRTTKDSAYLDRITRAIADDSKHPRHQGVAMQAHHVISATAMHVSGLSEKIRKFGYDINLLENLVFLPSTLQGACHLGVQPHRGNHTAPIERDGYEDDDHPRSYHDMVSDAIKRLNLGLTRECPGYMGGPQELAARHKVKTELDELSAKLLRMIRNLPREAPLTKISAHFQPGNQIGCAGTDSTTRHNFSHACAVERNHHKSQGPDQRRENITFESDGRYKLNMGR